MSDPLNSPSPRRSFVQRAAAGLAALSFGGASAANAGVVAAQEDGWIARIRGKHRQMFDGTMPSEGSAMLFALNWLDTTTSTLKVAPDDITAVVVLRHFAMPLALNDALWAKYHIGDAIKVTDPATKAPAVRNVFKDNILLHPGMTYAKVAADRRVVVVVCNLALTALSGMLASRAGVDAAKAKDEWTAGLIPGVVTAPSGVYAVHRAQQAGCTYCAAG